MRIALPSAVAPWGLAAPRTSYTFSQQDPPDGGAGQLDALPLCHHLGQMGVVEACVAAFGQLPDPVLCIRARGRRWLPAPVAVSYGSYSLLPIRCQQSPRMAFAHTHRHQPAALPKPPQSPHLRSLRSTPLSVSALCSSTSILSWTDIFIEHLQHSFAGLTVPTRSVKKGGQPSEKHESGENWLRSS